jgi:hypothetical protein
MKLLAFAFCSFIGYRVGLDLPTGAFAAYLPIVLSYHLFLAFLVISYEHEPMFPLPVFATLITRLGFMGFVIVLAMASNFLPYSGAIRLLIPCLALFECALLFSLGSPRKGSVSPLLTATVEEYDQFVKLATLGKRPFRKPGRTVEEEYERWLAARSRTRNASADDRKS